MLVGQAGAWSESRNAANFQDKLAAWSSGRKHEPPAANVTLYDTRRDANLARCACSRMS